MGGPPNSKYSRIDYTIPNLKHHRYFDAPQWYSRWNVLRIKFPFNERAAVPIDLVELSRRARVVEQLVDSSIVASPLPYSLDLRFSVLNLPSGMATRLLSLVSPLLVLVILSLYFWRILLVSVKGVFTLRLDGSSSR